MVALWYGLFRRRSANSSMDHMRSTYAIASLFAAIFVVATSSHAETGDGAGDGGGAAIVATRTPVSRPAAASRTRKAVSAGPKSRGKAKLTRVAVERKVIRAPEKP